MAARRTGRSFRARNARTRCAGSGKGTDSPSSNRSNASRSLSSADGRPGVEPWRGGDECRSRRAGGVLCETVTISAAPDLRSLDARTADALELLKTGSRLRSDYSHRGTATTTLGREPRTVKCQDAREDEPGACLADASPTGLQDQHAE